MSLIIKNSKELLDPERLKLKMLVCGFPGLGKTTFVGTAPNVGVASVESGHGNGILSIAAKGVDYITPENLAELEKFASGQVFPKADVLALDSLSDANRTFIKDYALSFPRSKGNSDKRQAGVPELDDYGTMGEVTRRLVRKLLAQDKHIIVTTTLRIDKPDPENGQGEMLIGPDLPGQMFLGSTAMFDMVLILRNRPKLRDPKDAKSRYIERYWMTEGSGGFMAKSRLCTEPGFPILDAEEVFDVDKNLGTFPYILAKAQQRLREFNAKKAV